MELYDQRVLSVPSDSVQDSLGCCELQNEKHTDEADPKAVLLAQQIMQEVKTD